MFLVVDDPYCLCPKLRKREKKGQLSEIFPFFGERTVVNILCVEDVFPGAHRSSDARALDPARNNNMLCIFYMKSNRGLAIFAQRGSNPCN